MIPVSTEGLHFHVSLALLDFPSLSGDLMSIE